VLRHPPTSGGPKKTERPESIPADRPIDHHVAGHQAVDPDKPGRPRNDPTHRNRQPTQPLTPDLDNGPGSDKQLSEAAQLLLVQLDRLDPGTNAPAFVRDRARWGSGRTRRVGTAELAHGVVELLGSLEVAHVAGARDHNELPTRMGPWKYG
jgi:hypothetical protein